MVVNQHNMNSLFVGYSAAFNNAYQETKVNYTQIAMTVPSSTKGNNLRMDGADTKYEGVDRVKGKYRAL